MIQVVIIAVRFLSPRGVLLAANAPCYNGSCNATAAPWPRIRRRSVQRIRSLGCRFPPPPLFFRAPGSAPLRDDSFVLRPRVKRAEAVLRCGALGFLWVRVRVSVHAPPLHGRASSPSCRRARRHSGCRKSTFRCREWQALLVTVTDSFGAVAVAPWQHAAVSCSVSTHWETQGIARG